MDAKISAFRESFKRLLAEVKGEKIAVAGHIRPDGDCVSSQVAAAWLFRLAGAEKVVCVNSHEVPYLYRPFICGEAFENADAFDVSAYKIVTVDCADYARAGESLKQRKPEVLACIDHHVSNSPYAEINIVDPSSCATAALLAELMTDSGIEIPPEIASVLYVGEMADTRQLTTSNTDFRAFNVAARLVELGADPAKISVLLYQREKFGRMKLLARFLQSLTMHFSGRVCAGVLPPGVYAATGSQKEDADGLVDYARNIDGVEIALLLEVLDDGGVKGSLRSKVPEMRVNEIAKAFGGGGHLAAAGFSVKTPLDEFYPRLLDVVESRLKAFDAEFSK